MKLRYILLMFLAFFSLVASNLLWVSAVAFPTQIRPVNGDNISSLLVPDWEVISWSQFPPISSSGSVNLAGETRSWSQGQTPDQYLQLGDINAALGSDLLTLDFIAQQTGIQVTANSLATFPLAGKQTVEHLIAIVPGLGNKQVQDVLPLQTLFLSFLGNSLAGEAILNLSISEVLAQEPALGNLTLNQIDLSPFSIASIPNLDQVEMGQFEQWHQAYLSQIPGLNQLPLAAFPLPLGETGNLVARIDAVWGTAERERQRTVSGSYNVGFEYPCSGQACPHIELDDLEDRGRNYRGSFEGRSWVSGKYQQVSGGSGCLQSVNGGQEPTGRHPYGEAFKVVVEEPDERTDAVDTALYFRFCNLCGCTPYFIGPVPFLTYQVNAPIFLGLSEGTGAASPVSSQGPSPQPGPSVPLAGELVQGINGDLLQKAIARITAGSYRDISPVVLSGTEKGRIFGRYGWRSFDPVVIEAVAAQAGGEAWLQGVARGKAVTSEELAQYFPPVLQERVLGRILQAQLERTAGEIEPQTGAVFRGSRLVARVAQKYGFGAASLVDGQASTVGGLTVQGYGQKVLDNYLALAGKG